MYANIAKNPLTGLNREKNKNIKASPKKRSSYKKKCMLKNASLAMRSKEGDCPSCHTPVIAAHPPLIHSGAC